MESFRLPEQYTEEAIEALRVLLVRERLEKKLVVAALRLAEQEYKLSVSPEEKKANILKKIEKIKIFMNTSDVQEKLLKTSASLVEAFRADKNAGSKLSKFLKN